MGYKKEDRIRHRVIEGLVGREWRVWQQYSRRRGEDGEDLSWVRRYIEGKFLKNMGAPARR